MSANTRFVFILTIIAAFTLSHLMLLGLFVKLELIKPQAVSIESVSNSTKLKWETYLSNFKPANNIIQRDKSLNIDPVLLQHLQSYNPSLPTNYTPTWANTAKYAEKKWKETMPKFILKTLHNKRDGIFVECGAFDGHFISNTLLLERYHNWTGLLVEADPAVTKILKERNRKAWVADVCLSPRPHPMKVNMTGASTILGHGYIQNDVIAKERKNRKLYTRKFEAQCYPLHMLLDAVEIKHVDYFSLDVEGVELNILKTIPWDRITIQLISVEVRPENKKTIQHFLEKVGYNKIKEVVIPNDFIHDHVYELADYSQKYTVI